MENLYEVLNVDPSANEKEIRKAYRRRAKECHPDKHQNNPEAEEKFKTLTKALESLLNPTTRAELDKTLKARKQAEERINRLDGDRKKFKQDLDAREAAAASSTKETFVKLSEKERIRKETERLIEEELLKQQERVNERVNRTEEVKRVPRIKIKWDSKKGDPENGGYNYESLHTLFSKYGDIVGLVVSKKKSGSALIEFSNPDSAKMAVQYEIGLLNKPIKLSWVGEETDSHKKPARDYESLSDMNRRRDEERRKLIEEMMNE